MTRAVFIEPGQPDVRAYVRALLSDARRALENEARRCQLEADVGHEYHDHARAGLHQDEAALLRENADRIAGIARRLEGS